MFMKEASRQKLQQFNFMWKDSSNFSQLRETTKGEKEREKEGYAAHIKINIPDITKEESSKELLSVSNFPRKLEKWEGKWFFCLWVSLGVVLDDHKKGCK